MNKSLSHLRPTSLQPFGAEKPQFSNDQLKQQFRIEPQQVSAKPTKMAAPKLSHLSFGAGLQLQPFNLSSPPQQTVSLAGSGFHEPQAPKLGVTPQLQQL